MRIRPFAPGRKLSHVLIEQLAAEIDLGASTRDIDELLASLHPAEWHGEARREVLVNYLGFPFWDVLTFPMISAREIGERLRLGQDGIGAAAERFRSMLAFGTTTIEVKSGYGLRTDDELKILRAAAQAGQEVGVDVVRTFLGAHAIPPEFEGRAADYVEHVAGDMMDAVASSRLASFCDVFVDDGFFTADQGRRILTQAKSAGLGAKVHADELADTGGAALAAEIGAASADHLLHASSEGIDALARTSVVGVLLPATSLVSHLPFADGRRLIAAGVPVALGTDFSPNCWCESPQLTIALACHHNGLLPAEAVVAATVNAAYAVGRGAEVGTLEPGKLADILVLGIPSYRHLGYRIGGNAVQVVIKRGAVQVGGPFR